jgi:hypothetical protein
MAKLTLDTVANPENQSSFVSQLNSNFDAIETALENTVSRDGTSPNTLTADLDLNNQKIVNLATPTASADAATKAYVDSVATSGVTGPAGTNGTNGTNGTDGDDGWAPVLAVVSDSARRVLQVTDWTGGSGTEPTSPVYIGSSGFTAVLADAVDIRGAAGTSGAGTGDLLAANNLSDIANATTARTNLGLAIGTDVQAYDAELAAIAGLVSAADRLPYFTGSGTASLATFTSAGRALIDDADASAQRTTLGLAIGTDVQAYDAELAAIAGLTSAADRVPYFTGSGTAALATFTSAGRALVDDADVSAQRTTLGLGDASTLNLASQAQAEAGLSNTTLMTPLRTAEAIAALASGGSGGGGLIGIQAFTSSGTYTPTTGAGSAFAIITGGGGGGGGTSTASGAGGGAAGATAFLFISSPAVTTVTIGSGGSGNTGNSAGTSGGTTSFGTTTAGGGAGGLGGGESSPSGVDGSSTTANATFSIDGGDGSAALSETGGLGGASFWGGGGRGGGGTAGSTGGTGAKGSGGGGGRDGGGDGGAGGGGIVVVFEFG